MEIYSCFNPGLAITIDWNRLSLILIPAWPETIDQCAELSSRFNDPTGPLFLFLSPGCLSLLRGKGGWGGEESGWLLHPKAEVTRGVRVRHASTRRPGARPLQWGGGEAAS